MTTIGQLLQFKGNDIWSVEPEATVFDALKVLSEKGIGALLVIEAGQLIGVFSERDYARKVILHGKTSQDTPVKDVMTRHIIYARPNQSVEECMALMTAKDIRHLPVLEEEQLLGVISIGDLVKSIIAEQEFMIEQLENYIMTPPTPSVQITDQPVRTRSLANLVAQYQYV